MIKQIFFISMLLLSIVVSIFTPKTYAILGVGDIVHDPASFMLQQEQYLEDIRAAIYTYYSWKNSVLQLEYAIRNLQNLDDKVSAEGLGAILASIDQLESIIYGIRGIGYSYQQTQIQFDQIYPSFQKLYGMSGKNYANQSKRIIEQTNNAVYDSMKAQGLISEIPNDRDYLSKLQEASQSADGILALVQISNQLLGTIIQQLMRMETIMATSYRAQSSYIAQQTCETAVSLDNTSRIIDSQNTLNTSGNGSGEIHFD